MIKYILKVIKIYLHNLKIKQNFLGIFSTILDYHKIFFLIYLHNSKIKQDYPKIK